MAIRPRGMPVSKQPPVFVPTAYYDEVMSLSKAALADLAWDYAQQLSGQLAISETGERPRGEFTDEATMREFRQRRDLVLFYRKQGKGS